MSTPNLRVIVVADGAAIGPETIKALAAGGILIDTGIPVAPVEPAPFAAPLPDNTVYSIAQANGGGNDARGDQELAEKVAMALAPTAEGGAGGLVSIGALSESGAVNVDYRRQLHGKRVIVALLTPNVPDFDAVAIATQRARDWFGAKDVKVVGDFIGLNAGIARIVHCTFTCESES